MATKKLTVVRPGTYGTRMLKAGDSLECAGPDARLYTALGWAKEGAPKGKRHIPTLDEVLTAEVVEEKPAPRKRERRKKTA